MKSFLFAFLLLPTIVFAEAFPVQYTEPSGQSGNLAQTCVYWCACLKSDTCNCTNWQKTVCTASDDGNGGDVKNPTFNVPIYQEDLPVTVRYTVTSVRSNGNETSRGLVGSTGTRTIAAP